MGVLLATAHRTVAAALWATGFAPNPQFHRYHRVLRHARWSMLTAGDALLSLRAAAFAPNGPLVFGINEMTERRCDDQIASMELYRDAVREYLVKASQTYFVASGWQ